MNILLVEPDTVLADTIRAALETAGYLVTWKRSAQTALNSLDETVPDLIILELQLGVHNGIELLYEMNSYPEWQHIPVIVHTINTKAQDLVYSQSFGQLHVQAVLYKLHTSTQQLVKAVKQFALTT
ncbi:MAG TPA: response regulator [Candidatus Saccharimonadales bacterium]|nr:response regulator [Candidatus Saccharimonadales bacterium]